MNGAVEDDAEGAVVLDWGVGSTAVIDSRDCMEFVADDIVGFDGPDGVEELGRNSGVDSDGNTEILSDDTEAEYKPRFAVPKEEGTLDEGLESVGPARMADESPRALGVGMDALGLPYGGVGPAIG